MKPRMRVKMGGLDPMRCAARVFRIRPDQSKPHVVEVRIARTRRHMHAEVMRIEGTKESEAPNCMGMVRHYLSRADGRYVVRPGLVIARMYLNIADLRDMPGEIVSHECTHAGMAWARLRKANLKVMPGEEVLCHAVGRMVVQINSIGYKIGIWE